MAASYPNTPNQSTNGFSRFLTALPRAIMRRCPFCGASHIFRNWFSLKEQCPGCGSVFEPEEGYMLGSYVVNLGLTALIGVLFAFGVVFGTDLDVVTIQIAAVFLVILIPLFMYGYSQLLWISIDLLFNNTGKFDPEKRYHH